MFGFAMGKVWNTFWSGIKFFRVRIENNLEGGSYWFDILWVKRGKEFLSFGEFSSKTLLLQKFLGSWFWLGTYFKSFGEGGGWVCRRQCVSMMTRGISFFKLNWNVWLQNFFSHIVIKTNWGVHFWHLYDQVDQNNLRIKLPKWLVFIEINWDVF